MAPPTPPTQGRAWGYNQRMVLAVLYLVVALVVFVGATVVAALIMIRIQAKRGDRPARPADAAMVSMIRSRRRRLDRRLGIHEDEPADADGESGGTAPAQE